ncbi:histidine kinase dimerization/phosphoacceptor domain-containing protein [Micromonospora sp. LA-10]|uniref:histidine kinase dimerization/phosphoacceptor domain-containing protein n=1 Tax=Micromonospora sp. LA-10 TaxID=3446364 RepID=UPI003F71EF67
MVATSESVSGPPGWSPISAACHQRVDSTKPKPGVDKACTGRRPIQRSGRGHAVAGVALLLGEVGGGAGSCLPSSPCGRRGRRSPGTGGAPEVQQERLRLAREFHDVVAHQIAAVNVQTGVAVAAFDQRPDAARAALAQARARARAGTPCVSCGPRSRCCATRRPVTPPIPPRAFASSMSSGATARWWHVAHRPRLRPGRGPAAAATEAAPSRASESATRGSIS